MPAIDMMAVELSFGLKLVSGEWATNGHTARIVRVDDAALSLFAQIYNRARNALQIFTVACVTRARSDKRTQEARRARAAISAPR